MRSIKRVLLSLTAGASLLTSGCLGGTLAPNGATRGAIYSGLLTGVAAESASTAVNLIPVAEAAAILWNQPIQNWLGQLTGNAAGIGSNNTGF